MVHDTSYWAGRSHGTVDPDKKLDSLFPSRSGSLSLSLSWVQSKCMCMSNVYSI